MSLAPIQCEYYVSLFGSDSSGTGAIGYPWATITHANLVLTAGCILHLGPGNWTESWTAVDGATYIGAKPAGLPFSFYGDTIVFGIVTPAGSTNFINLHFQEAQNWTLSATSVSPKQVLFQSCMFFTAPFTITAVVSGWSVDMVSTSTGGASALTVTDAFLATRGCYFNSLVTLIGTGPVSTNVATASYNTLYNAGFSVTANVSVGSNNFFTDGYVSTLTAIGFYVSITATANIGSYVPLNSAPATITTPYAQSLNAYGFSAGYTTPVNNNYGDTTSARLSVGDNVPINGGIIQATRTYFPNVTGSYGVYTYGSNVFLQNGIAVSSVSTGANSLNVYGDLVGAFSVGSITHGHSSTLNLYGPFTVTSSISGEVRTIFIQANFTGTIPNNYGYRTQIFASPTVGPAVITNAYSFYAADPSVATNFSITNLRHFECDGAGTGGTAVNTCFRTKERIGGTNNAAYHIDSNSATCGAGLVAGTAFDTCQYRAAAGVWTYNAGTSVWVPKYGCAGCTSAPAQTTTGDWTATRMFSTGSTNVGTNILGIGTTPIPLTLGAGVNCGSTVQTQTYIGNNQYMILSVTTPVTGTCTGTIATLTFGVQAGINNAHMCNVMPGTTGSAGVTVGGTTTTFSFGTPTGGLLPNTAYIWYITGCGGF